MLIPFQWPFGLPSWTGLPIAVLVLIACLVLRWYENNHGTPPINSLREVWAPRYRIEYIDFVARWVIFDIHDDEACSVGGPFTTLAEATQHQLYLEEEHLMTKDKLEFGLNAALPENCPFAWGARAIYTSSNLKAGRFDIPMDRRGSFGPANLRQGMLQALEKDKALEKAAKELYKKRIGNDDDSHHAVYIANGYVIKARSYGGYIYLAAYPNPDFPPNQELYAQASAPS